MWTLIKWYITTVGYVLSIQAYIMFSETCCCYSYHMTYMRETLILKSLWLVISETFENAVQSCVYMTYIAVESHDEIVVLRLGLVETELNIICCLYFFPFTWLLNLFNPCSSLQTELIKKSCIFLTGFNFVGKASKAFKS